MHGVSLYTPRRFTSRKRWVLLCCSALTIVMLQTTRFTQGSRGWFGMSVLPNLEFPWMDPSTSLNFPHPTTLARANLRDGNFYVTGFAISGFTNEFIAYMQIVYLGLLSGRIPIIPPIIPSAHISLDAGTLLFGEVFNLTSIRDALRIPIIEWGDVKIIYANTSIVDETAPTDPALEHFGCWSTQRRSDNLPTWVGDSESLLKLDLSFTHGPSFAYFDDHDMDDIHTTFAGLAATILPKHPHPESRNLPLMAKSRLGFGLPPDEQLACFDFVYYLSSGIRTYEFENRWSPAWNTVGTHLKFNEPLVALASSYLRRCLKLEGGLIPPVITVHIRRGDFGTQCKNGQAPPCYIPISKYRQAVSDLQKKLLESRGIDVHHIHVASDEEDPAFWEEVDGYGWSHLNHTTEKTEQRFGKWYPILIDKVILTFGVGFVGTQSSTFSLVTARRVEDWNDGEATLLSMWD